MLVKLDFLDLWRQRESLVMSHLRSSTEAVRADELTAQRLGMNTGEPVLLTKDKRNRRSKPSQPQAQGEILIES